jgi:hypothetical protein
MDPDGYPDDVEIETIKSWPIADFKNLLDYVKVRWKYADAGYWEEKNVRDEYNPPKTNVMYEISTGGWSGNEDLIGALQDNTMFWLVCWYSSVRGGHYVFIVKPDTLSN